MSTESKVLIAVAAVVTIGMSVLLIAGSSGDEAAKVADAGKLVRADSIQSNPKAKVTVVEFGDLQCPACKAAQSTVDQVKSEFKQDVNLVWRHFPLAIHQNAKAAANAAEAANAEGKFFQMQEKLFATQDTWSAAGGGALTKLLLTYATSAQVDGAAVEQAVKDQQYKQKIDKDLADGEALGVNSTPTFFVNGKLTPTAELRGAIQAALKQGAKK